MYEWKIKDVHGGGSSDLNLGPCFLLWCLPGFITSSHYWLWFKNSSSLKNEGKITCSTDGKKRLVWVIGRFGKIEGSRTNRDSSEITSYLSVDLLKLRRLLDAFIISELWRCERSLLSVLKNDNIQWCEKFLTYFSFRLKNSILNGNPVYWARISQLTRQASRVATYALTKAEAKLCNQSKLTE